MSAQRSAISDRRTANGWRIEQISPVANRSRTQGGHRMSMAAASAPDLRPASYDTATDTLLTAYDTTYAWNYGTLNEGLRDLYEKAKREQWNGTEQLKWDTQVDP